MNKTRRKFAPDPANYVQSKNATKSAAKIMKKHIKWDHNHLSNQSGRQSNVKSENTKIVF